MVEFGSQHDHFVLVPLLFDRIIIPYCVYFAFLVAGVQCAAVNVFCELARKNPKNYLSLAPTFFKLMTNSSNNWMLIKIIKLVS